VTLRILRFEMHIIGTAGHVDHGKSTLVAALTGTNPDRWLEEQLRGMTLDLGFAALRFPDGIEAGIIDVPGHERFLHNMLAGAAGMDLLLLVVDAVEGVRTQTIEHLEILRFLNVRRVLVAVTKIDLVEATQAGAACQRIHEQLQGTIAAGAPCFAVSTVTGENLQVLAQALHEEIAALAARDPDAPAYLPVDRVFALPGRGTIVTGTLMQGRIAVGDTLALEPGARRARVRSLHVFNQARDVAFGGTRVALNLPGADRAQIARGHVVSDPRFSAQSQFMVQFSALPSALELLRRRTPVRAHIGSAEILATLVFEHRVPKSVDPVTATLFLREPVLAFPGVRFVVRRVSPKTLLGGGEIATAEVHAAAGTRDAGVQAVLSVLEQRALEPSDMATVAFQANLREEAAARALELLLERGDAVRLARPVGYLAASHARALLDRAITELERIEEREPWVMGATSLALARELQLDEPLLARVLVMYADDGRVAHRAGYFSTLAHQPKLSAEQRGFFESNVQSDAAQPFLPTDFETLAENIRRSHVPGLARAFDTLLARGVFVKVGDALYRGTQIAQIHAKIDSFVTQHGRMTMAEFRDLLATSRKYAVPLLEWFDGRGITVRSGDYRMLRKRKEPA
jgi:selenocysteine-specific elongation factor